MKKNVSYPAFAFVLLLALMMLGCGGGALSSNHGGSSTGSTSTTGSTSGGATGGLLVSAANGGIVASADGKAVVVIPKKALSVNTKISVNAVLTGLPAAPQNTVIVPGTAFDLGPEGQFFNSSPSLSLVYDPAKIPSGISERDLQIYTVVNGGWQPVLTAVDDPVNHVISTPLAHFSTYAVISLASYSGSPNYDLVDIGVISGDSASVPYGISSDGRVVGVSTSSSGLAHAFQWANNITIDLGKRPGDIGAKAFAINASGLAGGLTIQNTIKQFPVEFQYGGVTQISAPTGEPSAAITALNDGGTYLLGKNSIVLQSTLSAFTGFAPATGSGALNLNDQVAGYTGKHAAIWTNFAVTDVGLLKGFDTSSGTAISDAGDLAGIAYNLADNKPVGFFYTGGNMIEIAPLANDDILVPAGCNAGKVVGTSSLDFASPVGFIYDTATAATSDLNKLVPSNSGWSITQAIGINANGQIIATGTKGASHHALLLNPRPGTVAALKRKK